MASILSLVQPLSSGRHESRAHTYTNGKTTPGLLKILHTGTGSHSWTLTHAHTHTVEIDDDIRSNDYDGRVVPDFRVFPIRPQVGLEVAEVED